MPLSSLPTKLLLTILSLLLVFVGIFYFLNKTPETAQAWYSSSWEYRRPISVGNTTGGSLSNADVLITLDTATLISAGKMQSDCRDLRLVDSDDTTLLTYWIEAGCNTSTTQVWARIPSILSVGKTIFAYYKNSGASDAQAAWTGKFIILSNTSCPTGWTRESAFDNRFPYGSSTYGTTGIGATTPHIHNAISCTTGGPTLVTVVEFSWDDPPGSIHAYATNNHTHTISNVAFSQSNHNPPFRTMLFCSNNKLIYNSNMVALSKVSPVSGWNTFSNLTSRIPMGSSSVGTTGGSTTHSHTLSVGTSTSSVTQANSMCIGGTPRVAITKTHSHASSSGTAASVNSMPPYINVIYMNPSSTSPAINNVISMVSSVPPLGWTQNTSFNSRFPYGAASYGGVGGTQTHIHSTTITTAASVSNGTVENQGTPTTTLANGTHTHSCTQNSSSVSNIPAYHTTLFADRLSSQPTTLIGEEMYNQAPSATNLKTEGLTNPTGVTDTTPEFQATFTDPDGSDTGVFYQIQVNTNNTFTGTTMWDSTKTAMGPISNGSTTPQISYNTTPLSLNGTTYYWRMKVWDQAGGESAWSSTAQFTMNAPPNAPSTPYCEGATNPSSVTDATPEFSAIHSDADSDAANYYQIQVNTNNTFTGTTMWDSTKTGIANITSGTRSPDISYAGSALSFEGTTYYWRIKFWDINNLESSWSTTQQFTTAPSSAFSAPINCLIEKSNTNSYLNVIWSDTSGNEDNFEIQRSLNGGGWTTLSSTLPPDTTSYQDNSVSSGNTYQYQIRSIFNGPLYSGWCLTPTLDLRLGNIKFEQIQFH